MQVSTQCYTVKADTETIRCLLSAKCIIGETQTNTSTRGAYKTLLCVIV